ncbi:hypothetical protein NHX12_026799 [Muraenolepis orangiensis]|uniref:Uncharacterized protein n=1 Tax=Muraenolepis orangiensis TaxID=630683 RepID=A0A9Q0IR65_9TELE|nr:hypothetical protein NHX12_026799 [Muraenolepis orangiensis]
MLSPGRRETSALLGLALCVLAAWGLGYESSSSLQTQQTFQQTFQTLQTGPGSSSPPGRAASRHRYEEMKTAQNSHM